MGLKLLDGFDWNAAKEYLETDEMIAMIAESFVAEIDDYKANFSTYFADLTNETNVENYVIKAHAIKSTTKMLGNMAVSDYAKELEFAGVGRTGFA